MWLAQFLCAPQFFKTPSGLCGHTVYHSTNRINTTINNAENLIYLCIKLYDYYQVPCGRMKMEPRTYQTFELDWSKKLQNHNEKGFFRIQNKFHFLEQDLMQQ
jgi:hypothetical protein